MPDPHLALPRWREGGTGPCDGGSCGLEGCYRWRPTPQGREQLMTPRPVKARRRDKDRKVEATALRDAPIKASAETLYTSCSLSWCRFRAGPRGGGGVQANGRDNDSFPIASRSTFFPSCFFSRVVMQRLLQRIESNVSCVIVCIWMMTCQISEETVQRAVLKSAVSQLSWSKISPTKFQAVLDQLHGLMSRNALQTAFHFMVG